MNKLAWSTALPSGWKTRRLRHIAHVQNSNVDKKSYEDGVAVRLCNYTDVYYNEYITSDLELMKATATPSEAAKFELRAGDVIITKDSEAWDDIAVPACARDDLPGVICGYHLTMLRPHHDIHGPFLLRAMQADGIREQFWLAANGVTRYGLGQQGIKDAVVPVPPLSTQRAIAAFLDRKTAAIDALIEKKQKLLTLLAEKRAALIHRAVTKGLDPNVPMKDSKIDWIGRVPEHWEVKRLKTMAKFTTSGSRGWAEYYTEDASNSVFLQSGNLGRHLDVDLSTCQRVNPPFGAEGERTLVKLNDVLVCITGARTGAVAVATDPILPRAYINQHVCLARLMPEAAHPLFIGLSLSSDLGQAHFQMVQYGGTKQGLGLDDVQNCWLAVPPRAEQEAVATQVWTELRHSRRAERLVERTIDHLREYRQALITAAVTGQLDIQGAV